MTSPRRRKKLARLSETAILTRLLREFEALVAAWHDDAARDELRELLLAFLDRLEAEERLPLGLHQARERLAACRHPRDLMAFVVPVERALDRAVRDEDVLPRTDRPEDARDVMPVTVVADSLRSAFNVGGLLRTAEGFGVSDVVLTGYSPTPDDPRCARTALGADRFLPWTFEERLDTVLASVRDEGRAVIALETGDGIPAVGDVEVPFPCAVVIGNERFGLPSGVVERADLTVCIPMSGRKGSLNVVTALGILLHDLRRQYGRRASR